MDKTKEYYPKITFRLNIDTDRMSADVNDISLWLHKSGLLCLAKELEDRSHSAEESIKARLAETEKFRKEEDENCK